MVLWLLTALAVIRSEQPKTLLARSGTATSANLKATFRQFEHAGYAIKVSLVDVGAGIAASSSGSESPPLWTKEKLFMLLHQSSRTQNA